MACCHSDLGIEGSGVWRPGLLLWVYPLSPWQWSRARNAVGFLQAADQSGTLNMVDHCKLEGRNERLQYLECSVI